MDRDARDAGRVRELFERALELPPAARRSFLSAACAGDTELLEEVEGLLGALQRTDVLAGPTTADLHRDAPWREDVPLPPGTRIARYEIAGRLGAGGMGTVYRAVDTQLSRPVALKFLAPLRESDADARSRFLREAQAAARLDHPSVGTVYEVGEHEGRPYIAMAYYEGETLEARIRRGPMPVTAVEDVLGQVAAGLAAAHGAGIVHRDLKPANVIITPSGSVKLVDFGVAKLIRQRSDGTSLTGSGVVIGTVAYMSPEQARAEDVDHRTDLWSLGVMAYEMLSGASPFDTGSTASTLGRILAHRPTPVRTLRPDVPARLSELVDALLQKDRDERPRDAVAVAGFLRGDVGRLEGGGRSRRRRLLAGIAITSVLAALLSGGAWLVSTRSATPAAPLGDAMDSIAVLPFEAPAGDVELALLGDGLTELVISALSQVSQLRVMARSSVFALGQTDRTPHRAAEMLRVRTVLLGRVARRGEDVTVSVELLDTRDNRQIWGDRYQRRFQDLPTLEQDIASEVARALRLRLTADEVKRLAHREAVDPEAYRLYLAGRQAMARHDEAGFREAVEKFGRAVVLQPSFALAHVGIARAHYEMSSVYTPPGEAMPRALESAERALAIDPNLADAHVVVALVRQGYHWDFAAAGASFERAIQANPGLGDAHLQYGCHLTARGRFDEAEAEVRRALALDPLSRFARRFLVYIAYCRGKLDQARELAEALHGVIDPDEATLAQGMGMFALAAGRPDEAIAALEKAVSLEPSTDRRAWLGMAYGRGGRRVDAEEMLRKLDAEKGYVAPTWRARILIGMGDHDGAFQWLEKAWEEKIEELIFLDVEPAYAPLRSDARYADLKRRVGLTP